MPDTPEARSACQTRFYRLVIDQPAHGSHRRDRRGGRQQASRHTADILRRNRIDALRHFRNRNNPVVDRQMACQPFGTRRRAFQRHQNPGLDLRARARQFLIHEVGGSNPDDGIFFLGSKNRIDSIFYFSFDSIRFSKSSIRFDSISPNRTPLLMI